jgi:MarR family transcriptional regulator, lower aerobic nicotinate degradation pathway regulator
MNPKLLKELIDQVHTYEVHQKHNKVSLAGFKHWWLQQEDAKLLLHAKNNNTNNDLDLMLVRLLVLAFRYARLRTKVALQNTGIGTLEELGLLATLVGEGQLSKLELIEKNVLEKTTGFEIIKRLVSQKLVAEIVNPNDKRSKLVRLTAKGQKLVFAAFASMESGGFAQTISEPLEHSEKLELLQMLTKLQNFHHAFYLEHK